MSGANPAITTKAIYLLPGMSYKIKSSITTENAMGYFPRTDPVKVDGEDRALNRGFVVRYEEIGTIDATTEQEVAVVYTHKKPAKNEIWFYALTGEKGIVEIISVPIHDHSSIVQGGPAYGTYFSDDEADEE